MAVAWNLANWVELRNPMNKPVSTFGVLYCLTRTLIILFLLDCSSSSLGLIQAPCSERGLGTRLQFCSLCTMTIGVFLWKMIIVTVSLIACLPLFRPAMLLQLLDTWQRGMWYSSKYYVYEKQTFLSDQLVCLLFLGQVWFMLYLELLMLQSTAGRSAWSSDVGTAW